MYQKYKKYIKVVNSNKQKCAYKTHQKTQKEYLKAKFLPESTKTSNFKTSLRLSKSYAHVAHPSQAYE